MTLTERAKEPAPLPPPGCADCGCRELTLISDGQCVTIYKCPQCGRLLAPVKNTNPNSQVDRT
jgi:hypothetical protein